MKMVEVGSQFGHLTVVGHEKWNVVCRCSCGEEVKVLTTDFLRGKRKSCGHLGKEMFRNYPVDYTKGEKGENEDGE